MIEYYINVAYTENPVKLIRTTDSEKDLSPQTNALFFIMFACGIYRIFDKPLVSELLSRMAIILKHQGIVDNFFKDDSLFRIKAKGYKYTATMKDIEEHLGLEIADGPYDIIPRKDWLKNIKQHWRGACVAGALCNNPMLERTAIGRNVYKIGARPDVEVTTEYQNVIDLFAREALKCIPENKFEELQFRVAEVRQNLANYRKELATEPKHKFSYARIPQHVKAKICDACFGKMKNKEVMYIEPMFVSLCYLAWLWANGYIRVYQIDYEGRRSHTADVDPRMDFNYNDFDGLNSLELGINIYDTFHDFNLDKVCMLLKEK
ncbi:MAG TPA: hypothetical protein VK783_00920 [Bacteroidia bacterium]|jgi:hypothetical protein|nr:hypothetical protein [Bacteroidia bacterium]